MIIFVKRNHITVVSAGATCFCSSIPVLGVDPPARPAFFPQSGSLAAGGHGFRVLVFENRHCTCSPGSCPGAANGVSWASHWTFPGLTPLQLHMGV